MQKIYRIEHIPSQEHFKDDFPADIDTCRVLQSTSITGVIISLPDYCISDRSKNYTIVILTDEELDALKGLEAKTK